MPANEYSSLSSPSPEERTANSVPAGTESNHEFSGSVRMSSSAASQGMTSPSGTGSPACRSRAQLYDLPPIRVRSAAVTWSRLLNSRTAISMSHRVFPAGIGDRQLLLRGGGAGSPVDNDKTHGYRQSLCSNMSATRRLRFQAGFLQPLIDLLRDPSPERPLSRNQRSDLGVGQVRPSLEQLAERPMRIAQERVAELFVGRQPPDHYFDAALRHRSSAR